MQQWCQLTKIEFTPTIFALIRLPPHSSKYIHSGRQNIFFRNSSPGRSRSPMESNRVTTVVGRPTPLMLKARAQTFSSFCKFFKMGFKMRLANLQESLRGMNDAYPGWWRRRRVSLQHRKCNCNSKDDCTEGKICGADCDKSGTSYAGHHCTT